MVTDRQEPWWGLWRAAKHPSVPVPLGARSVGRANCPAGWSHRTGRIHWINLYWGIEGLAGLQADGVRVSFPPEHLVIHPPETLISGYAIERPGRYRWWTLDGELAPQVLQSLGLTGPWPRRVGRCPEDLFDQLERELQDCTPAAEFRASATVYEILTQAARGLLHGKAPLSERPLVERAALALERRYTDAQLTVERLADELGVHRSQLSREFRAARGISPSHYLRRLRLRRALGLLRRGELAVKEVALASGFADPAYLSRCVSSETGRSPSRLRGSF